MKKAYLYFLAPIAGVILFSVVYWNFLSGYEKHEEQRAAKILSDKVARQQQDQHDRERAAFEAKAAQDKRKADQAAKAIQKQKEDEEREAAKLALAKARTEADKLVSRVGVLTKDVADTKAETQKIEEEKVRATTAETFLKEYVKKAEANRASLMLILEKIDAADKAAADAAKAAAAATKK